MTSIRESVYQEDKTYNQIKAWIEKDNNILKKDKKLILEFNESYCSSKGLSKPRKMLYLRHLRILAKLKKKSFDKMQKKDMEAVMASIMNNPRYSDWTKETFKIVLKVFYRWLYNIDRGDPLPDVVKWIQGTRPPNKLRKDELITKDDLKKMIDCTNDVMYKAMLSVLYEGALRPGELLQMRIKDVIFDDGVTWAKVTGKMKSKVGERVVYFIHSVDLLRSWINTHPFKDDKDYALWIVMKKALNSDKKTKETYGKPISLRLFTKRLRYIGKKAGLTKRIYPYLFRHSAATEYYSEIGEAKAKKLLGHARDSKMASVYCHLNEQDVLDALMRSKGIKKKEKIQDDEKCPRCGHINSYGAKICSTCSTPLDIKGALDFRAKQDEEKAKIDKLIRFVNLLEKSPKIMRILEDPKFKTEQAEMLNQGEGLNEKSIYRGFEHG